MKKILLVSGCSWTDKTFKSDFHPTLDTSWKKWPELLGHILDMEVVNLGKCGQGNEYIYSSLLDYIVGMSEKDRNRIGLVIPAWSAANRRDWQTISYSKFKNSRYPYTHNWSNDRYDYKGDIFYFLNRSLRLAMSFQLMCEKFKLPYIQIQMIPILAAFLFGRDPYKPFDPQYTVSNEKIKDKAFEEIKKSPHLNMLNDSKWLPYSPKDISERNWSIESEIIWAAGEIYRISEKDRHPNAEGQVKIAEYIYENI